MFDIHRTSEEKKEAAQEATAACSAAQLARV
jgi:hypothetical protein